MLAMLTGLSLSSLRNRSKTTRVDCSEKAPKGAFSYWTRACRGPMELDTDASLSGAKGTEVGRTHEKPLHQRVQVKVAFAAVKREMTDTYLGAFLRIPADRRLCRLRHSYCWRQRHASRLLGGAHARRQFVEAAKTSSSNLRKGAIGRIKKLYELEKGCGTTPNVSVWMLSTSSSTGASGSNRT
jgi:hypothetical protein